MSYESFAFDATLAAAAGEDEALFAELRASFVESVARLVDLLSRARCDGNWHIAAMRLKGLGAGCHAFPLIALAEEALESAPGDPVILARLAVFQASLTEG